MRCGINKVQEFRNVRSNECFELSQFTYPELRLEVPKSCKILGKCYDTKKQISLSIKRHFGANLQGVAFCCLHFENWAR